jgi:hypothetical protein
MIARVSQIFLIYLYKKGSFTAAAIHQILSKYIKYCRRVGNAVGENNELKVNNLKRTFGALVSTYATFTVRMKAQP